MAHVNFEVYDVWASILGKVHIISSLHFLVLRHSDATSASDMFLSLHGGFQLAVAVLAPNCRSCGDIVYPLM
jgi:hypothetical protein